MARMAFLVVDNVPQSGWHAFQSSNVIGGCYPSERSGILWIRFKSGSLYTYSGVPKSVWLGLLGADSKGKYHHKNIKWNYPYVGPLTWSAEHPGAFRNIVRPMGSTVQALPAAKPIQPRRGGFGLRGR